MRPYIFLLPFSTLIFHQFERYVEQAQGSMQVQIYLVLTCKRPQRL